MTLEDLKTINLSADRPPAEMSDDQWQEYFNAMRPLVCPVKEHSMKCKRSSMMVNGLRLENQSSYSGDTQWYYYCQFINSVLSAIRHNKHDFCYNIYQITDLLKFEHDRLATKWLPDDRCIEVWLK